MKTAATETPVWRGDPKIYQGMGRADGAGEKVRRRRYRTVRRLLLLGLFGVVAFKGGEMTRAFIAQDPTFRLKEVVVEGALRHDPALLRGVFADLEGSSLLDVGADDVGQRLAPFPWVKGFLFRKHYPHTLTVEVTERPQLCAVAAGGRVVEIDGYGHVWPAVQGVQGVFETVGVDPSDAGFQALVESLLEGGLTGKVAGIAPSACGSFILRTPDGWSLRVAAGGDLAAAWERYRRARPWAEANFPERRALDLRWEGRVILEAPPTAAGEGGAPAVEKQPAGV
jgi:hypothetical protein